MRRSVGGEKWELKQNVFAFLIKEKLAKNGRIVLQGGESYVMDEDASLVYKIGKWGVHCAALARDEGGGHTVNLVAYGSMVLVNVLVLTFQGPENVAIDMIKFDNASTDEALVLVQHSGRSSLGKFRLSKAAKLEVGAAARSPR